MLCFRLSRKLVSLTGERHWSWRWIPRSWVWREPSLWRSGTGTWWERMTFLERWGCCRFKYVVCSKMFWLWVEHFSTRHSLISYCSCLESYPCWLLVAGGNPSCLLAQDTSVRGLVPFATLGKQRSWCRVRIMGVFIWTVCWVCMLRYYNWDKHFAFGNPSRLKVSSNHLVFLNAAKESIC